ncbi:hypothetical protein KC871_04085 [Candidatus Saccharibacteria bacterium]|nr:hypothetical protein [Candidatus Saccharibacteria bacterium]
MTTKKVVLIILGIFIGIPATLALIAFCFGFVMALVNPSYFDEKPTTQQQIPPSLVQSDTPSEQTGSAKSVYMSGCDTDGTTTAYCSCTYDYLSSRYSIADMAKMGDYYEQTGDLSNEMWAAVEACL